MKIEIILSLFIIFSCGKKIDNLSDDGLKNESKKIYELNKKEIEKNKLLVNKVQNIINKRNEQHKCDEFNNQINKKGIYIHIDGTIHETQWIDEFYVE